MYLKHDLCKLDDFLLGMYTLDLNVYLYARKHLRSNTTSGLYTLRSCLRVVFIDQGLAKVNEQLPTFIRSSPSIQSH
jgi:hypothetical protein